jgi:hypothetical protein
MKETAMHAFSHPVLMNLTLSGVFKKVGDAVFSCFIPIYMMHTYPH